MDDFALNVGLSFCQAAATAVPIHCENVTGLHNIGYGLIALTVFLFAWMKISAPHTR